MQRKTAVCADLTHNRKLDNIRQVSQRCDADLTPPRWTTMDWETIHSSDVVSREKLTPNPRYRRKQSAHVHTRALSKNRMQVTMQIRYMHTMASAFSDLIRVVYVWATAPYAVSMMTSAPFVSFMP